VGLRGTRQSVRSLGLWGGSKPHPPPPKPANRHRKRGRPEGRGHLTKPNQIKHEYLRGQKSPRLARPNWNQHVFPYNIPYMTAVGSSSWSSPVAHLSPILYGCISAGCSQFRLRIAGFVSYQNLARNYNGWLAQRWQLARRCYIEK
jgi:hypothetical protein